MLRLMRAGAGAGRPALVVRLVAGVIVLGMLVTAAPFLAGLLLWVIGLL